MTHPPLLSVEVSPYRLRFHGPFVTASGTHSHREGFLVCMTDGDGNVGWGEVAPLPEHGTETLAAALDATEGMIEALVALLADGEVDLPRALDDLGDVMSRLAATGDRAPAALAGIDGALADLAARRASLPLAVWLNAAARSSVPVNGTIGAVSAEKARRRARALVRDGYGTIKVKVGVDDLADIERITAVRDVVGSRIRLRADANGAWDELRAEVMLESLNPARLEFLEQPVPADDIDAMARLRAGSRVRVAADESLLLPDGVKRVLDAGAADVLVLKPALMGGLVAALKAAEAARRHGVAVVVTTALESAIGRMGALHLAAALPDLPYACGLATGGMMADDVANTPEAVGGVMQVAGVSGIGISPSPAGPPPAGPAFAEDAE